MAKDKAIPPSGKTKKSAKAKKKLSPRQQQQQQSQDKKVANIKQQHPLQDKTNKSQGPKVKAKAYEQKKFRKGKWVRPQKGFIQSDKIVNKILSDSDFQIANLSQLVEEKFYLADDYKDELRRALIGIRYLPTVDDLGDKFDTLTLVKPLPVAETPEIPKDVTCDKTRPYIAYSCSRVYPWCI